MWQAAFDDDFSVCDLMIFGGDAIFGWVGVMKRSFMVIFVMLQQKQERKKCGCICLNDTRLMLIDAWRLWRSWWWWWRCFAGALACRVIRHVRLQHIQRIARDIC